MEHTHRWIIEPATQTKPIAFSGLPDGELYTDRLTRGNLQGVCRDCREQKVFHPFSGCADIYGSRGQYVVSDPALAVL